MCKTSNRRVYTIDSSVYDSDTTEFLGFASEDLEEVTLTASHEGHVRADFVNGLWVPA
jgi:hypothetical protein